MSKKISKEVADAFSSAAHHAPGTRFELRIADLGNRGDRIREDYGEIAELAAEIEAVGLVQDIAVMAAEQPGKYRLLEGGRRVAAYVHLGRETIPAVVREAQNPTVVEASVEKSQKRFNPFERLKAYRKIMADVERLGDRRGRPALDKGEEGKNVVLVTTFFPGLRRGEKTREYALRASGISRATLEALESIESNAVPRVLECVRVGAISVDLGYEISQEKQAEQEKLLRAADKDGETDKALLREVLHKHRESKRLVKAGIDPSNTFKEKGLAEDGDPAIGYNLIYCHVPSTARGVDVDTLSKIPIAPHTFDDTLVCISCKNEKLPHAIHLLEKWGLSYAGTITVADLDSQSTTVNYLGGASAFIVVGKTHGGRNKLFSDLKVLPVDYRKKPPIMGRIVVEDVFGPEAADRLLDLSAPKDSTLDGIWTNYKKTYGV